MATMNVSLSDQLKDWVDDQMKSGRYDTASEYVRDLIRHDQDRAAKIENLRRLVDEGRASGVSAKSIQEIGEEARRQAREQGLID